MNSWFKVSISIFSFVAFFILGTQISHAGTYNWTARTGAGARIWNCLVASPTGEVILGGANSNYLYISTNSGSTWSTYTGYGSRSWRACASSADGSKLLAAPPNNNVHTSTDSGANWTSRGYASYAWRDAASSSDGTKLAMVTYPGYIFTSTDSGVTWTQRTNSGSRNWYSIASSPDGVNLVAVVYGGYIYTSADSGATWTERTGAGSRNWIDVAASADGSKFAAAVSGGYVYTSTDYGATWTEQTGSGSRSWASIALSPDGSSVASAVSSGYIYTSQDGGVTWVEQTGSGSRSWTNVTFFSNGTKITASVSNAYIYTADYDVTAPTVTEVTPIGTTADSTPDYTFSTTEAGTITYGGSCSSATTAATAGSNTITLNALTNGTYADCTITVTDAASNVSNAFSITSFTVNDATAPTLAEIVPVRSNTYATKPSYVFSSNESGTITYGGSCDSSTTSAYVGYNVIMFNTLTPGTYSDCTITVTDLGTNNTVLPITTFTVLSTTGVSFDWTDQQDSGAQANWKEIVSSVNGLTVLASRSSGYLYTSSDGGVTWTERTTPGSRAWKSIAISADGTKMIAAAFSTNLWTSSDSGVTWTERTGSGSRNWQIVTSSADGTKLAAGVQTGYIYTSTDSGATWTERTSAGSRAWQSLASSADGTKLVAGAYTSYLYTSSDAGVTWTERTGLGLGTWYSMTASADGTKFATVPFSAGYVHTSSDSGATWTAQTNSGSRMWSYITSSVDGSTLVALANSSSAYPYISTDYGVTWTTLTSAGLKSWLGFDMSYDTTHMFGVTQYGPVYTYGPVTTGSTTTGSSVLYDYNYVNLSATITDYGSGVESWGFEYGTTVSYGTTLTSDTLTAQDTFSEYTPPLACGTTYHYRSYVTNPAGTSYGNDATFTTNDCPAGSMSVLYGTDGRGNNPSAPNLYTIDPDTGDIETTIGPVGYNLTGLAFHPETGILYGVSGGQDPTGSKSKSLFTVNKSTGAATWLGNLKTASNEAVILPDIAFRSNGVLYGFTNSWGGDPNTADLYTVDLTSCDGVLDTNCLVTKVGDSGLDPNGGHGIAFDSNDNLYFFGDYDTRYWILNPDTGVAISSTSITNPSGQYYTIGAATFNSSDDLYLARHNYGNDPADLVIFDTTENYLVSPGHSAGMVDMDAIAFFIPTTPVLSETTPIGSTTNTSPAYTFSTTEAGTITYGGSCSSATTNATEGSNTIILNSLAVGTYSNCTITVTDVGGTASTPLAITSFTITSASSPGGVVPVAILQAISDRNRMLNETQGCTNETVFSPITGYRCPNTPAPQMPQKIEETPVSNCPILNTKKVLKLGMIDKDILTLQQILNCKGYTIALNGPGSSGKETNKFGSLTRKAVMQLQKDFKLVADGVVGAKTRGVLNQE